MSRWLDKNVEFLGSLPKKCLKGKGKELVEFADKW